MKCSVRPEELEGNEKGLDSFTRKMGIVYEKIEPGYARAKMELSEEVVNPLESVHGGAMFTLADVTAGVAATAKCGLVTTVEGSIHYANPAFLHRTKYLTAETREVKCGKKICIYDVDLTEDTGKLIATARMTFFVMPKTEEKNGH